jgi:RNA-directed DNA polymerase
MYKQIRIPKKSGGTRILAVPSDYVRFRLPFVTKILEGFLKGYMKLHLIDRDFSVLGNKKAATEHKGAKILVCLDISKYFDSITPEKFFNKFPFKQHVQEELTPLMFYMNRLPTGASTSNIVARFYLAKFDAEINRYAKTKNCTYTRYVDDIAISGEDKYDLQQIYFKIVEKLKEEGLQLNDAKSRIQCRGRHQSYLGITTESIGVGRKYIKRTDLMLKHLKQGDSTTASIIRGRISYTKNTNPEVAKRQRKLLVAAL